MSTQSHKHLDPEAAHKALAEATLLGQDPETQKRRWKVRIAAAGCFILIFALYLTFVFRKYDWAAARAEISATAAGIKQSYSEAFGDTSLIRNAELNIIKEKFTNDAKAAAAKNEASQPRESLPASPDVKADEPLEAPKE